MCAGGVRHTVRKLSMIATSFLQTSSQLEVWKKIMTPQSGGSPNRDSFGTPPWESPRTKNHLDVTFVERCRVYYMGKGGDFPRVRTVVSLVSSESPVTCPSTKGDLESELTNLLVSWMLIRVSNWKLVILPSPNSEPQHALLPLLVLRVGSVPQIF